MTPRRGIDDHAGTADASSNRGRCGSRSCDRGTCGGAKCDGATGARKGRTSPTVAVTTVSSQVLDRPMMLPGDLSAFQDVEIRARVAGFVEAINVDRGSTVKKGQLLARLAAPELTAQRVESEAKVQSALSQRIEAEARLAADEAKYQHLKTAAATPGVVAGNDVEVALKAVEADRARVDSAKQNEKAQQEAARSMRDVETYLRIEAPFDGVVTERSAHEGSLVGPGTPALLRVQQVSRLRLVVAVPEDAVGEIAQGQTIAFTVPAFPGEKFSGKIARASRALDPKTRTMPVELDVVNTDGKLAPGMFANVAWTMRRAHPSLFCRRRRSPRRQSGRSSCACAMGRPNGLTSSAARQWGRWSRCSATCRPATRLRSEAQTNCGRARASWRNRPQRRSEVAGCSRRRRHRRRHRRGGVHDAVATRGYCPAKIAIDGQLTEAAWQSADAIEDFRQTDPVEGAMPSARTRVQVLADHHSIVIGVTCEEPDPTGIVSFSVQRDAILDSEDHIRIVLGPFADGRSGYILPWIRPAQDTTA